MKKITFLRVLLLTLIPTSLSAQENEGINQTTFWNFDQFIQDDNVANNNPFNYGGLYIIGHSADKYATISENQAQMIYGDYTYFTNTRIDFPGGQSQTLPTSAKEAKEGIALDVACPGTLYVTYYTKAPRTLSVAFAGKTIDNITTKAGQVDTKSFTNGTIGTYYISTSKGPFSIYAVKFVPTSEEEATKTLTLSQYGINTFSDNHAWKLPEGLKAYYARSNKNSSDGGVVLGINEIKDIIPACTGVILKGDPNSNYTLTSADCGTITNDDGKSMINTAYALRPIISDYHLNATNISTDGYNNYLLGAKNGKVIFGPAAEGTIKAGKAYYRIKGTEDKNAQTQNASKSMSLDFGTGGTTNIQQIQAIKMPCTENTYNAIGQIVNASYKGMVIKNGKKYIQK